MREYCLDCVIKHLGQAFITQIEASMGYPEHNLLTIGHLAEASEECFGASEEMANEIRQYRLNFMADSQTVIPYFDLYRRVKDLIEEKGCGNCKKASKTFRERVLAKQQER
jgi:hypothetical protein